MHLAANTDMNVTTHDDQLAVFAAESLRIETLCFPRVANGEAAGQTGMHANGGSC